MNILVACEFSGIVQHAFYWTSHHAVSIDLLPTEKSTHHIEGNVLDYLDRGWDMMLAFPPCTYLASSGARWFKTRPEKQEDAIDFVKKLMDAPIPKIVIENPIGVLSTRIRKPDQIIQPWMFGVGETKATCLWLKNLPKLKPTNIVDGRKGRVWLESPGPDRWKRRSRTYPEIANAMASQWGSLHN